MSSIKKHQLSVLIVSTLFFMNILLSGIPSDVQGLDTPQIETDDFVPYWTGTAGNPGQITIHIGVLYYVSTISTPHRLVPYPYVEVIDCSDESIAWSGLANGQGSVYVQLFAAAEYKVRAYMGASSGTYGRVVNSNSEIYYGTTPSQQCNLANDYECVLEFADSGDPCNSFVGAAAIYATLGLAKLRMATGDNDGSNGDINVKYFWPVDGESRFYPASGQTPAYVEIGDDYFDDDDSSSWSTGYDSARHQFGHVYQYEIGYEEDYWPSGTPSTHDFSWDQERTISPSGTEKEWAYVDGVADFVAAYCDIVSPSSSLTDDLVYDVTAGTRIETDVWNDIKEYAGDVSTGIRGECTEGAIAQILWDLIDDSSYPDMQGAADDDSISISLSNLWIVINTNSVHTILDFWDVWMWQSYLTTANIIHGEFLYLYNNVARYQYNVYSGPSENQDDLKISFFEIRGMNPVAKPQKNQYVLIRYLLKNVDDDIPIDFNGNSHGYDIGIKNPAQATNYYDAKRLGQSLDADTAVIKSYMQIIPTTGTYYFWPHYLLQDNSESPSEWHALSVAFYNDLWSDAFGGTWPGEWHDGYTAQGATCYWGKVQWGAGNNMAAWCAGMDTSPGQRDPNQQNPALYYVSDQYNWMYVDGDFRYVNLHIDFSLYLDVKAAQGDTDFLGVYYYDDINDIYVQIISYDQDDNTQQVWSEKTVEIPPQAYSGGQTMIIRFLFDSDANNPQPLVKGAFIDNVVIAADR